MNEELTMDLFDIDSMNINEVQEDELNKEKEENNEQNNEGNNNPLKGEDVFKEEDKNEGEDEDSSPKSDLFQKLAEGLVEDGILPDIKEEDLKDIKDASKFSELIEKQVEAKLEEANKRVYKALNNGVEPSSINRYENVLNQLNNISDESIEEESEQAEKLRKQLIYTDYINRGFSEDRAKREVEKSIKNNTDIEDAKDALESNKDFYKNEYESIIKEKEEQAIRDKEESSKKLKELVDLFNSKTSPFEGLNIDNATKKKALDTFKTPKQTNEDGISLNAIQVYAKENPVDYNYKLAILFTLTDGFKNISNISKSLGSSEKKKIVSNLEKKLNNMNYSNDGSIDFSLGEDSNSMMLDI